MATNKVYYSPGTVVTFRGTGGGDVLWTMQNAAAATGRISDVWDRGAGALPARYLWRCTTKWSVTPALGDMLRLYLVTSSASATASLTDGGLTFGDAALSDEDPLMMNCVPMGGVVADAVDQAHCASGIVLIYERYAALAGWNSTGSETLTNVVTDHICTFTPIPDDIQAAS
jgi:hypothetical protein